MRKTIKIIVSGKVQGVCYRAYTHTQAEKLGLYGFVRNLSNGDVEIVATGEQSSINALIEWAEVGSPYAIVDNVNVKVKWSPPISMWCFHDKPDLGAVN